jgi:hypothetical protein
MAFIQYSRTLALLSWLVPLCLLSPCIVSAQDNDENKPQPINYKLNCNVYGYAGEKNVLSGDTILLDLNAKSPRELLVNFTDSSRQVSVTATKVFLAEDGRFSLSANSPEPEARRESRLDYDFHWRYGGSYVVVTRTSCLQCVAQRSEITATGICDIHQVQMDESPK